jgi:DNA-binding transcriptional ArsR family regulator
MTDIEPDLYRELRSPRQVKAFADPLRIRMLHLLAERRGTNQQVAAELGEPPAKVFHHLHVLLDAGLIQLVETRISGKNVEKLYRTVARNFILRPAADVLPETRIMALGSELDRVRRESLESALAWGDGSPQLLRQVARLHPDQLAAFHRQLHALIRDFWGTSAGEAGELPRTVLTVLTYREPPHFPAELGEPGDGAPDD